jgi:hypothetical protein
MKTILEALTELRGQLQGTEGSGIFIISTKAWDEFVAKYTQEYATDLTPDAKEVPRAESDLDSLTRGSDSTQKFKVYYNSRTDSLDDLKKKIDVALEGLKYAAEKQGPGAEKRTKEP